jgi:transposase
MKEARRRRAVVVFLDESGFSLIPYVGKTWAPVGQTPVLVHPGRWPKFSAIGGVMPRGRLYFRVRARTIRGPQVVAFLRHLLRHIRRRPIMVFWDSGSHHRSNLVRAVLATKPRLEVHRLPGYSPELNSDEWVWSHLKKHELASYAPNNVRELRRGVRLSVVRMRARPKLIRSFVTASHLYY